MSEQIDWSKAPADATHHKAEDSSVFELWLKPGYAVRVSRGSPDWVRSDCADKLIADGATARPTTPSWSGEGLPPVGVACKIISGDSKWWSYSGFESGEIVTVRHSFKNSKGYDMVVVEGCDGGCLAVTVDCVAVIRTPEQIAAYERGAAVDEMHKLYMEGAKHSGGLYALYDAGYRKQ